jgi:exopolysaccharide biosynthesis polyprenyl glycosylphosphotransferase
LKQRYTFWWFIGADLISSVVAWLMFFYIRKSILNEIPEPINLSIVINSFLIGSFWVFLFAIKGAYQSIFQKGRIPELFASFNTVLQGVVVLFFVILLDDEGINNYKEYYLTFISYLLIQSSLIGIQKLISFTILKEKIRRQQITFRTIIIGSGKRAAMVNHFALSKPEFGYQILGYIPIESNALINSEMHYCTDIDAIDKYIKRAKVDHIIIALEEAEENKLEPIINTISGLKVKVSIIPENYKLIVGAVTTKHITDFALLEINIELISVWQKFVKRLVDVLVSGLVLIIGLPFYVLCAILTKMSSKGSIFFTQERVGLNGQPFRIIKFRSMYVNAEFNGPALSKDNDRRITPWGLFMRKSRIDEMPQFWNVLKGDMSLVGPRPERQHFIDQIIEKAPQYRYLQKVRPGITSLGQVRFGYASSVDEMVQRLQYDILYIENLSLSLDFEIMVDTIMVVIQGRGK